MEKIVRGGKQADRAHVGAGSKRGHFVQGLGGQDRQICLYSSGNKISAKVCRRRMSAEFIRGVNVDRTEKIIWISILALSILMVIGQLDVRKEYNERKVHNELRMKEWLAQQQPRWVAAAMEDK